MRLELETGRFYLGRDYSEAIEASGAVPVHIPLIPKAGFIAETLGGLDGVVLPGSDSDVDPSYYREEPHPKLGRVVPEKDATDLLVLAEIDKLNIPLLAICFGMQFLNVSRGGTLIQDIGSQIESAVKHEQGKPLNRNSHSIIVSRSGILASLTAAGSSDVIKVNSHHHQAIGVVGENLIVTATARDGVVECIEDTRSNRFVLGVQWHPELSWQTDVLSRAIFDRFVDKCKERRSTVPELVNGV